MTIDQLATVLGLITMFLSGAVILNCLVIWGLRRRIRQLELDRRDLARFAIQNMEATRAGFTAAEKDMIIRDKLIFGEDCYADNK